LNPFSGAITIPIHSKTMAKQGNVKWFDAEKGYGFISPSDGSKDIFVHRNNVENLGRNQGLEEGEEVEFSVEETPKGLSAVEVRSLTYE
jgi:cold shock protein